MTPPSHKQESVVRVVRLLAILGCLSTNRKICTEGLLNQVPEIRGLAFGKRTLQRDLNFLVEFLPIYHDNAVPRGYRLRNTIAGHALQEISHKILPYLRNVKEVELPPDVPDIAVSYQVYRAVVPSWPTNAALVWEPHSEKLGSILAAIDHRDLFEKRSLDDYSGPSLKFKIVKIIEETLS